MHNLCKCTNLQLHRPHCHFGGAFERKRHKIFETVMPQW